MLLVLLPLAAVFLAALLGVVTPISFFFLLVALPLLALAVVAVRSYRQSQSVGRAIGLTALAFSIAVVGAAVYLGATWPEDL